MSLYDAKTNPESCRSKPRDESIPLAVHWYSGSPSGSDYSGFAISTSGTKEATLTAYLAAFPLS